jgi:low affinity Fe/Cu permease
VLNNTFRAGINYGALAVGSHLTFASYIAGITAWSLTPSVISASTSHYTLNATFANFYDVAGCTVSIKADLERAP